MAHWNNSGKSTTRDTGDAILTNQRVVFVGGNRARELDLGELLGLEIGDDGFKVSAGQPAQERLPSQKDTA